MLALSHVGQGFCSPLYSPELDPAERWFLEFRRALSNKTFESVELLQQALTETLVPYWRKPARLQRLTGFSWWVIGPKR